MSNSHRAFWLLLSIAAGAVVMLVLIDSHAAESFFATAMILRQLR